MGTGTPRRPPIMLADGSRSHAVSGVGHQNTGDDHQNEADDGENDEQGGLALTGLTAHGEHLVLGFYGPRRCFSV